MAQGKHQGDQEDVTTLKRRAVAVHSLRSAQPKFRNVCGIGSSYRAPRDVFIHRRREDRGVPAAVRQPSCWPAWRGGAGAPAGALGGANRERSESATTESASAGLHRATGGADEQTVQRRWNRAGEAGGGGGVGTCEDEFEIVRAGRAGGLPDASQAEGRIARRQLWAKSNREAATGAGPESNREAAAPAPIEPRPTGGCRMSRRRRCHER